MSLKSLNVNDVACFDIHYYFWNLLCVTQSFSLSSLVRYDHLRGSGVMLPHTLKRRHWEQLLECTSGQVESTLNFASMKFSENIKGKMRKRAKNMGRVDSQAISISYIGSNFSQVCSRVFTLPVLILRTIVKHFLTSEIMFLRHQNGCKIFPPHHHRWACFPLSTHWQSTLFAGPPSGEP